MRYGTAVFYCDSVEAIAEVNRAFHDAQLQGTRLYGLKLADYIDRGKDVHEQWRLHAISDPPRLLVGIYAYDAELGRVRSTWRGRTEIVWDKSPLRLRQEMGREREAVVH